MGLPRRLVHDERDRHTSRHANMRRERIAAAAEYSSRRPVTVARDQNGNFESITRSD